MEFFPTVGWMPPAAALPDPSDPTIIAFGAALGAFYSSTKARRRHDDRAEGNRAAIDGGYYGTAVALIVYLVINVLRASIF